MSTSGTGPEPRVELARPNIGEEEVRVVTEVLRSGVLSLGPYHREFERMVADLAGRRHAISCSSGTAGLHMAVRALGIGEGDEVLTTPFSFVASANCILYERAMPRFVDIEEESLGMNPELVSAEAGPRVRAILPVDVFGQPCRISDLAQIARERGWRLVEDSCEALGSTLDGRPLGSFGDVGVFAFYPNKQITTGEGGMVVTDDEALAATMRSMRNQGRDEDGTWLRHVQLGFNYRMDELSAALGVIQLRRYSELREGRRRVVASYERALGHLAWLALPKAPTGADVDWFVYVVRLDPKIERDALIGQLAARGVAARPYFSPLHLQPFYRKLLGHRPGDFPVTERVAASTLALPFSSLLTDGEIDRVASTLADAVEEQAARPRGQRAT